MSLVRLISRHFIFFEATTTEWHCVQNLLLCMFVVGIQKIWWVLKVDYLSCHIAQFIISRSFLVKFLWALLSVNRDSLTFLPICSPLIFFSCITVPSSALSAMLKRSGDSNHPCLIPDLSWTVSSLSQLGWSWLWVTCIQLLLYWGMCPPIPHSLRLLSFRHLGLVRSNVISWA